MTEEVQQNALIVSLNDKTNEIEQLAATLGYSITQIMVQQREKPDVNYFIGTGKLEEIKELIESNETDINLVIVDGILKPSQWFNLEKSLNIVVHDRIHIILSIFEDHAQRKEAQLQVKLAQLRYERPYVRELIHRARAGEHPGFMAGGEYQVDDYYEMIKKQIKKIGMNLKKIENSRLIQRKNRHQQGFYLVSLAGYTNAGKSSLMNMLTDAEVRVEGKLFSTLSTTTRKLNESINKPMLPILLTDTVGFIDDLPSWVVDAFHATLEEIEMADIVLLVIDGSELIEDVRRKVEVSLSELHDLKVTAPIIILFNKYDLINEAHGLELQEYVKQHTVIHSYPHLFISTKNKESITSIYKTIYIYLPNLIEIKIFLSNTADAQSLISYLYTNTDVKNVEYGSKIKVRLVCNSKLIPKILNHVEQIKGRVVWEKQKNI